MFTDEFQLERAYEEVTSQVAALRKRLEDIEALKLRLAIEERRASELEVLLYREQRFSTAIVTAMEEDLSKISEVVRDYLREQEAD
jgi:hypothetical protein